MFTKKGTKSKYVGIVERHFIILQIITIIKETAMHS